jgi:hypothetical protein
MFVLKAISTSLSRRASDRNRKVSFASTLSTSHTYELSIEERGAKFETFKLISKNCPAREQEVAHFQIHGHWPEDVKAKM